MPSNYTQNRFLSYYNFLIFSLSPPCRARKTCISCKNNYQITCIIRYFCIFAP